MFKYLQFIFFFHFVYVKMKFCSNTAGLITVNDSGDVTGSDLYFLPPYYRRAVANLKVPNLLKQVVAFKYQNFLS